MDQPIDAIYENGVFKPLQPVSLPEHAQVRVVVKDDGNRSKSEVGSTPTDSLGYPAGYFESTAGSFADEPLERSAKLPQENRESW